MDLRLSNHSVYRVSYHVVFCTKYRRRILNSGLTKYIEKTLPKIIRQMPGVEVVTLGFDDSKRDHVHMEIIIPPKYAVSDVVAQIKSRTSSALRKKFDWLSEAYWKENIVWSHGYFVSTIGVNERIIRNYIKWQGNRDSGQMQLNFFDSNPSANL